MIIYAEEWNEKTDSWQPRIIEVDGDDAASDHAVQLSVSANDTKIGGVCLRLTADQAALLLAALSIQLRRGPTR